MEKSPDDLASNIEWNSIFRSATALSRNSKRILADEVLNQKVTAINLLRSIQKSLEPSKIFDAKILGKFLAITRLWQPNALCFTLISTFTSIPSPAYWNPSVLTETLPRESSRSTAIFPGET